MNKKREIINKKLLKRLEFFSHIFYAFLPFLLFWIQYTLTGSLVSKTLFYCMLRLFLAFADTKQSQSYNTPFPYNHHNVSRLLNCLIKSVSVFKFLCGWLAFSRIFISSLFLFGNVFCFSNYIYA